MCQQIDRACGRVLRDISLGCSENLQFKHKETLKRCCHSEIRGSRSGNAEHEVVLGVSRCRMMNTYRHNDFIFRVES
jgi:hypothetical protein